MDTIYMALDQTDYLLEYSIVQCVVRDFIIQNVKLVFDMKTIIVERVKFVRIKIFIRKNVNESDILTCYGGGVINNKTKCGWCGEETTRTYKLKDGKYLCLECAKKHYSIVEEKMNRHIEEVEYGLKKKKDKLNKFIYDSCDHSEFERTGYCVGSGDNMKEICNCKKCGKRLYMEWKI